jgi:hypothetical protein
MKQTAIERMIEDVKKLDEIINAFYDKNMPILLNVANKLKNQKL